MGDGQGSRVLEQRDGAPSAAQTHHPTARSERWECKTHPSLQLRGWERLPDSSMAMETPDHSAAPLGALGSSGGAVRPGKAP